MAINKKLIHFKNFSDFNSKKLSANENNTQYTLGINGAVTNGSPDILYQSICYIKDTKQQWTHGQLYDGSKSDTPLNETDPVFSASPAATITEKDITAWNGAVQPNDISDFITIEDVAAVATSGDYNDLTNKPTIPAEVIESTVSGWGFTKNTGTYSKPSDGIPKSDLDSAVQRSLGKADTALQSYTEQYKGTVTSIIIDGVTMLPSYGAVDLGPVNKPVSQNTATSMSLQPNIYYINPITSLRTLTITLAPVTNNVIMNEYFVEFTTSSSGTTVNFPSTIKWVDGTNPTWEAGYTYQVSIVNNLGTYQKFK